MVLVLFLINKGRCVAKHINNKNNIQYYAQEIRENTYNLTRIIQSEGIEACRKVDPHMVLRAN